MTYYRLAAKLTAKVEIFLRKLVYTSIKKKKKKKKKILYSHFPGRLVYRLLGYKTAFLRTLALYPRNNDNKNTHTHTHTHKNIQALLLLLLYCCFTSTVNI